MDAIAWRQCNDLSELVDAAPITMMRSPRQSRMVRLFWAAMSRMAAVSADLSELAECCADVPTEENCQAFLSRYWDLSWFYLNQHGHHLQLVPGCNMVYRPDAVGWSLLKNFLGASCGSASIDRPAACCLFRDLSGDPFQPIFVLPRDRQASIGFLERPEQILDERALSGAVSMLAERAYHDRRPDGSLDSFTLAALADALEETGAAATFVLHDLRAGSMRRRRGYWAVDLLRGQLWL